MNWRCAHNTGRSTNYLSGSLRAGGLQQRCWASSNNAVHSNQVICRNLWSEKMSRALRRAGVKRWGFSVRIKEETALTWEENHLKCSDLISHPQKEWGLAVLQLFVRMYGKQEISEAELPSRGLGGVSCWIGYIKVRFLNLQLCGLWKLS